MARMRNPRWVAFRFPDPMCSPRIKQDEDLGRLLEYLIGSQHEPTPFGPAIYYQPTKDGVLVHERRDVMPLGKWEGGMKIRLFESVGAPPAPGVEFIKQTEFIEGKTDGKEEE